MGLFGGGSTTINYKYPEYSGPSAQEIAGQAFSQAQGQFPLAYGAREQGLANIGNLTITPDFYKQFPSLQLPELSQDFFQSFGPTSFEESVNQAYLQDAMEQARRQAMQISSLSGIENLAPTLFTRDIGNTLTNLGQQNIANQQYKISAYLNDLYNKANLGQQQAQSVLSSQQAPILSQLGIDPFSMVNPLLNTGMQMAAQENAWNQNAANTQAQIDISNMIAEQKAKQAKIGNIGSLIGMGVGALAAPFTGGLSLLPARMSMGAGLGGALSGGTAPIDLGTSLMLAGQLPGGMPSNFGGKKALSGLFGSVGQQQLPTSQPMSVFQMPSYIQN